MSRETALIDREFEIAAAANQRQRFALRDFGIGAMNCHTIRWLPIVTTALSAANEKRRSSSPKRGVSVNCSGAVPIEQANARDDVAEMIDVQRLRP